MRAWLAKRIPNLKRVRLVNKYDMQAVRSRGLIHRILVGLDMAIGQFGSPVQSITISSRAAVSILKNQESFPGYWGDVTPIWSMFLGAVLESIDPGHLQSAMQADFARACVVQDLITGSTS